MKSNYKRLGEFIQPVDERNVQDRRYELLGVSVEKRFIDSIANTVGTDWHTYKIIRKGQFCYIPDTSRRGDKIGIALLTDREIGLVSAVYTVFEVVSEQLIPEYLMLWFKRTEFDRYARFHSHGSAREIFDWEEMCNVEVPIPEIEEQRKIVEAYNTLERRIEIKRQINDNLSEPALALFKAWFVDFTPFNSTMPNDWREYRLSEFLPVITGKKNANVSTTNGKYPFFSCSQDVLWTDDYSFEGNAILVAGNGDFNVKFYNGKFEAYQRTYVLIPYNARFTAWLYYAVKYNLNNITLAARGSVIKFITKGNLEDFSFFAPASLDNLEIIDVFANINETIENNRNENMKLSELRDSLLPRLMSGEMDVSSLDL